MTALTMGHVAYGLTGQQLEAPTPITRVVIDSRKVVPGALFVALPGENVDGHQFVADAFQQGAVAAITQHPVPDTRTVNVEQGAGADMARLIKNGPVCFQTPNSLEALQQLAAFWRRNFENLRVIGVTGSVGKSTTKELLWNVLNTKYHTLKNEGNFNNEIGLPLTLLQLTGEHQRLVLEMGMYALGEIELLCQLAQPQVGVVTNVGPVHLETTGNH
jgi:UDP-N-acetylmuramoyl-tripeptide--D-alanyl-D-alanine ligase